MHLAFVSQYDPADVRAYSGIPHFMVRALRPQVDRLSLVGPLPLGGGVTGRLAKLHHRLRGENYLRAHTWAAVGPMTIEAERQLASLNPDAIFSPSTLPLAALEADVPTAFWPDATFESNLMFYPSFTNLPDGLVEEAHHVERTAIERVSVAAFAADYAADSATGYYGVEDGSVHVIPYGANLEDAPPTDAALKAALNRDREACRLLFVGGGWVRKGGDVALRVAEEMTARGTPTTLTVAGPLPPVGDHPLLRPVGFLNKDVPEERARLRALFAESHFLCMPVRAEDFGCVFAEAAAFALPSLSTRVGGVQTAVDDTSGVLFRLRERPQVIAERALELFHDLEAYEALCSSARARYERDLNWETATGRLLSLIRAAP